MVSPLMRDVPAPVREADLRAVYSAPLSEFTSRRNDLAKRMKAAGESSSADWVRGLKKPAVTAWALNQLLFEHATEFGALTAAGEAVWKAQRHDSADVHREATERRQQAVAVLVELAGQVLAASGHSAGLSADKRMARSLESLAIYGPLRSPEPAGRMSRDLDPPGLDELVGLAAAAGASLGLMGATKRRSKEPAHPVKERSKKQAVGSAKRERDRQKRRVVTLEKQAGEKRSAVSQKATEHRAALLAVTKATERLDAAAAKAQQASQTLAAAETAERRALLVSLTADKELEAAKQELDRLAQ